MKGGIKKKKISGFDLINTTLVIVITIVVAYPLYFCIIASFSEANEVSLGNTLLWIKGFNTDAYTLALKEKQIWTGFRNSIFYTLLGTLYNLVLTIPAAYVMSKKYLPFRTVLSWYFFITMYIGGGLIPTYLLIKKLHMINTPWVLIIGAGVSCYNLIVTRQYFSTSIGEELYEAAYIDGAGEGKCFLSIALPLAKPIIAVMALYYGVGHWDSWYSALLYIQDKELYPLQLVLRNILLAGQIDLSKLEGLDSEALEQMIYRANIARSMKYSIVVIASAPLLFIYPFIQKYFVKGVMIGSVKG